VTQIAVDGVDFFVLNMRTRMPFRYGIATLTVVPHLVVRLRARIDGRPQAGQAAEGLPPKWFTKDPLTSFRQEVEDMLGVIRHAGELAVAAGAQPSAFDLWWAVYRAQAVWGKAQGYPPLLTGLGPSLVERALIDAVCRHEGVAFGEALREGRLGFRPEALHPELSGQSAAGLLPKDPRRRIAVRHTVGLADYLEDDEVPAAERVEDGLPQSLEACIRGYGLTHFKVKLFGDAPRDVARLRRLARVLAANARGGTRSRSTGTSSTTTWQTSAPSGRRSAPRRTWKRFWRGCSSSSSPCTGTSVCPPRRGRRCGSGRGRRRS
jgi:hypothetical protein